MSSVIKNKPERLTNKLKINPHDYFQNDDKTPKRAIRREIVIVDSTTPVKIDSARLMQVFEVITPRDLQYYFYILSMLEDTEQPIAVSHFDMRIFFKIKYVEQVAQAMKRLELAGLLFKLPRKAAQYIVNPAFAWIGDRTQYFDANSLELMKPKPAEDQ